MSGRLNLSIERSISNLSIISGKSTERRTNMVNDFAKKFKIKKNRSQIVLNR